MTHVITFVAAAPELAPAPSALAELLGRHGGAIRSETILTPGKACEYQMETAFSLQQIQQLRHALHPYRIDVFQTPAQNRCKKLLLADMDSTIVVGETLDELSDHAGVKEEVARITARAMNGEMDFHEALALRVALLENLPESALQQTAAQIRLMSGAINFISGLKKSGTTTVLVTGGFTYFAKDIAAQAGFDFVHGNQLDIKDGHLTGGVIPPVLDKQAKLSFLQDYTAKLGLSPDETMAIGDGANDLPMLEAAGLGIGYHPKPLLQEKLINIILYNDLSAALYTQGVKISI